MKATFSKAGGSQLIAKLVVSKSKHTDKPVFQTELGTRQFCHDNKTMFSGHKVVIYCNITVFVWLLPLDTEI